MSIQKLERVMWRLRARNPGKTRILNSELEKVIMYECGTDPTTYRNNRRALVKLGWIRSYKTKKIDLTDTDLTG